jgi:hypothetical protein
VRSLKLNLTGQVSVDWGSTVSGVHTAKQKAIVGMMTRRGSDVVIPDRGTDLQKNILGSGAFDLMGLQHQLNFAAAKTERDLRPFDTIDIAANVATFDMRLTGLQEGRVSTYLSVRTQADEIIGDTTTI